jgi:hypothetical protein
MCQCVDMLTRRYTQNSAVKSGAGGGVERESPGGLGISRSHGPIQYLKEPTAAWTNTGGATRSSRGRNVPDRCALNSNTRRGESGTERRELRGEKGKLCKLDCLSSKLSTIHLLYDPMRPHRPPTFPPSRAARSIPPRRPQRSARARGVCLTILNRFLPF